MDEKLRKALAIIISGEIEPDRINRLLDEGLASHEDAVAEHVTFDSAKEADDTYNAIIELFELAQSLNGSRGWATTADKYAPEDERGPRCRFDAEGNVAGYNY